MSEPSDTLSPESVAPALGLLELESVALGVLVGDAMAKRAPVSMLRAGTVHPGKFLVLVAGEVADVEESLVAGREVAEESGRGGGNARGAGVSGEISRGVPRGATLFGGLTDELFLPDVHADVAAALTGRRRPGEGDAVGVFETRTVASLLRAADRGVKGAVVTLRQLRLADDLGGKAYCVFRGEVADVEAALEAAEASLPRPDLLLGRVVVPRLHAEMLDNLDGGAQWRQRVRAGGQPWS